MLSVAFPGLADIAVGLCATIGAGLLRVARPPNLVADGSPRCGAFPPCSFIDCGRQSPHAPGYCLMQMGILKVIPLSREGFPAETQAMAAGCYEFGVRLVHGE